MTNPLLPPPVSDQTDVTVQTIDPQTMEAGRDLDALIAERVMGWKPWCSPCVLRGVSAPDCWKTGDRSKPTVRMSGWSPSRNIADAWKVVEKLGAWSFEVTRDERRPGEVEYSAVVMGRSAQFAASWRGRYSADAPAPSLAICRAALLAMEAQS